MESLENDNNNNNNNNNKVKSPKDLQELPIKSYTNTLIKSSLVHHPFGKSSSSSEKDSILRFNYFNSKRKRPSLMNSLSNSENDDSTYSGLFVNSYPKIGSTSRKPTNELIACAVSDSNELAIIDTDKPKKDTDDKSTIKIKNETESKSIRTISTLNRKTKDNNNIIVDNTKESTENDSIFKSIKMNTSYYAELIPLSTLPGATVERYLGKLSLHFVKDAHVSESNINDLGGFTYNLLMEVNSISRAHAIALGGNCILAYRFDKNVIEEGIKKYALISIRSYCTSII